MIFWMSDDSIPVFSSFRLTHSSGTLEMRSVLFVFFVVQVCIAAGIDEDVFVAGKEWKEVGPNQAIPAGLHVRMNLQTGKREARILSEEPDAGSAGLTIVDSDQTTSNSESGDQKASEKTIFLKHELENALKNIASSHGTTDEPTAGETGKQFRSMDELKKEFAEMNLQIKTDRETIRELIAAYNQTHDDPEKRKAVRSSILTDLEYYVHQIDNARDFVDMGGLFMVKDALNDSCPQRRTEGALLLGAATQMNPKVQIAVYEQDFIALLLHSLRTEMNSETDHPQKETLLSRLVFASASLIRNFPLAQKVFLMEGRDIFDIFIGQMHAEAQQLTFSRKHHRKFLGLINDLIGEKADAMVADDPEKARQYADVGLDEFLREARYCELLGKGIHYEDHEVFERAIESLERLLRFQTCNSVIHEHRDRLQSRSSHYRNMGLAAGEEGSDEYFVLISRKVDELLKLERKVEKPDEHRDEL